MAGRPRKPTALKLLEGNPGRRPLPPEPEYTPTDAAPPEGLTGAALEEWQRVAPYLVENGIVKLEDRAALEGYCRWFAVWRAAMIALSSGDLRARERAAKLRESATASKEMRAFQTQCGITPATHSKVAAPKAEKTDPYKDFRRARA